MKNDLAEGKKILCKTSLTISPKMDVFDIIRYMYEYLSWNTRSKKKTNKKNPQTSYKSYYINYK